MSLGRECSKCGEEYDARYGFCPVCDPGHKPDKEA